MEAALSRERKDRRQVEKQVSGLQTKVNSLQKSDAKLQRWEARKTIIHHNLGQVESMVKYVIFAISSKLHKLTGLPK